MSDCFLQHYWWFLISLLGALLAFLMFVQGGQSLLWQLGKSEDERRLLLRATGHKWERTFTTLVTFGGAFFAAFPLFYSTSFGGAYWVWMLILISFVLQAVSYEFQLKAGNLLGAGTYRVFLFANGVLGPLLIGTALGTFFSGAEFVVDKGSLTQVGMPVISRWANSWHGLEAVLNPWNVCLGLVLLFLARTLGCLYFLGSLEGKGAELRVRCRRALIREAALFLVFFCLYAAHWLTMYGFAVEPGTGIVYMQSCKFSTNLLEMPAVGALFLLGILVLLVGLIRPLMTVRHHGFWFVGAGAVLVLLAMLLCAGWNNTAYYPSVVDFQSSLTIANSSASAFTLRVMAGVSLFIPVVLAYVAWAWHALGREDAGGGASLIPLQEALPEDSPSAPDAPEKEC